MSITFSQAFASGDFEILQWLLDPDCSFDERACAKAALYGRLDFLIVNPHTCVYGERRKNLEENRQKREERCWLSSVLASYQE